VRYVGLVINRQRPKTAGGVTFMTLEDETGFVNLVVWRDVFAKYALLAKTVSLLGVTGHVQSESGVVHVIAREFWEPRLRLRPERGRAGTSGRAPARPDPGRGTGWCRGPSGNRTRKWSDSQSVLRSSTSPRKQGTRPRRAARPDARARKRGTAALEPAGRRE